MKLAIIFASGVFVVTLSISLAQQPSPNTSSVPAEKGQQQQPRKKRALTHPTPNTNPELGSEGKGKRSTRNPRSQGHGTAAVQSSTASAQQGQGYPSYSDALRRYRHEPHERIWWKRHFTTIVLVRGGYYYWDAGYWCPAWGYDPAYQYYDYDGPIYTYGNLLPDQVIANVQRALQQLGYYSGAISGGLSGATRSAIAAYQEDYGLEVTAVVDAATVAALGLI